ncbi:hypothetical protein SAMN05216321_102376 [Cupriavidus sp. OV038]|jgi:hypothetical protein|uniref:hypothetical protein n=1 Tax=unclassified Cupriavidus TaxID=2640874 RepID=UPI0008E969DE|nr:MULTISPECIES: hypothetical protein [unclassified Cupriavidus]SFB98204.1 hypothetical protein SAMN05216321_102376 [Cupriavidus sp. OV038]SFO93009.1 hypothetical protein SAMN05216322_103240 [Cupriavidus sp. OV096]
MKQRFILPVILAFACLSTQAAGPLPPGIAEVASSRIKVSTNPYYRQPLHAMKHVLLSSGKNGRTNRFCAVGYKWPDGTSQAWVLWDEEQTLMLWRGNLYRDMRDIGLTAANRTLKLGRDTVPTPDDINGSTYLVTEAWWRAVANDCRKHGEKYVIKPFKAPKPKDPGAQ